MTPLTSPSCVILCVSVSGSWAQLRQKAQGYPDGPAAGGFVSPSDDYGVFGEHVDVKQYERPDLPYADYYGQSDAATYENYNIDEIEKRDELELAPILSILVPSLVIGLVN